MFGLIVVVLFICLITILVYNKFKKKIVFILLPVLFLILIPIIIRISWWNENRILYGKSYSIEELFNVNLDNVAYSECYGKQSSASADELGKIKLKEVKKIKTVGSTANSKYIVYDNNMNILFEWVEIGNRDLIKIDGKLYQKQYNN